MTQRKLQAGETFERNITLDTRAIDQQARTVPASLSSETPVSRWFGNEILVHTDDAIDLSRTADGLPMLFGHNQDQPIGLVENIYLDGDRLRGTLRFSNNAKASEIFRDVADGFLKNISIGYRIDRWEEEAASEDVKVTRWTLMETSIVTVPADASVGINRAQPRGNPMPDENLPETPGAQEPAQAQQQQPNGVATIRLADIRNDHAIVAGEARRQAIADERQRVAEITALFDMPAIPRTPHFNSLRAISVDRGYTADQTRHLILEALSENSAPIRDYSQPSLADVDAMQRERATEQQSQGQRVQMGESDLEKFRAGVQEALSVRAGIDHTREAVQKARAGGFLGVRLLRVAENYLRICGVDTRNLTDDQIAQRAVTTRAAGMTTSDFANILANTANKAMLMGWDQAPETWQMWVRIGQVPDFKQATRVGLSGFSSLEVVPEDGDIEYGKFTDRKETIQAVSYAKKFRLTYQAIKNDDLSAFTAIPRGMGRAANSIIGDMVYGLLASVGPTLNQDSTALFDASGHSNYATGTGAPGTTTFDAAFTAMATQTDPNNGKALNIYPAYALVPRALETVTRVLQTSAYDPTGTTASKSLRDSPNPFQNRFEVISDARLDQQSTLAWYLTANPYMFDTVEVAFVDGIAEPYLREEEEWDTRGVQWVCGVDFGVSALDFRGMYKHKGEA